MSTRSSDSSPERAETLEKILPRRGTAISPDNPLIAYRLFKTCEKDETHLRMDNERLKEFNDILLKYIPYDGDTYIVLQTRWSGNLMSYSHDGSKLKGDQINSSYGPSETDLKDMLSDLRARRSDAAGSLERSTWTGDQPCRQPDQIEQRWSLIRNGQILGLTKTAVSKWVSVNVDHGQTREGAVFCSFLCPGFRTGSSEYIPEVYDPEKSSCNLEFGKSARWLRLLENSVAVHLEDKGMTPRLVRDRTDRVHRRSD